MSTGTFDIPEKRMSVHALVQFCSGISRLEARVWFAQILCNHLIDPIPVCKCEKPFQVLRGQCNSIRLRLQSFSWVYDLRPEAVIIYKHKLESCPINLREMRTEHCIDSTRNSCQSKTTMMLKAIQFNTINELGKSGDDPLLPSYSCIGYAYTPADRMD